MTQPLQHILLRSQYLIVMFAVAAALLAIVSLYPAPASYWLRFWWLFPIAFAIALAVNTAGISGAALFVPFFILVFPLLSGTHLQAIDTVRLGLITESFGLSSSALAFLAFGLVDMKLARQSLLAALPFIVAGVWVVSVIPGSILYLMVAALLGIAVLLLHFENTLRTRRQSAKDGAMALAAVAEGGTSVAHTSIDGTTYRYGYTAAGLTQRSFGYAVGAVFQGATGFGVGEMGIIAMVISRIPMRIAIGTNHLVVATTAVAASIIHFTLASHAVAWSSFAWNIPVVTIPAVVLGGQLAPYLAARLPSRSLERFVSALFIVIATALIVLALRA